MLKRLRKINKTKLIESSRKANIPLPLAYAALIAAGVKGPKARLMVLDAATVKGCMDTSCLSGVVIWSNTKYPMDWADAVYG